jgi:flagellar biosynthesis regulator FlaF
MIEQTQADTRQMQESSQPNLNLTGAKKWADYYREQFRKIESKIEQIDREGSFATIEEWALWQGACEGARRFSNDYAATINKTTEQLCDEMQSAIGDRFMEYLSPYREMLPEQTIYMRIANLGYLGEQQEELAKTTAQTETLLKRCLEKEIEQLLKSDEISNQHKKAINALNYLAKIRTVISAKHPLSSDQLKITIEGIEKIAVDIGKFISDHNHRIDTCSAALYRAHHTGISVYKLQPLHDAMEGLQKLRNEINKHLGELRSRLQQAEIDSYIANDKSADALAAPKAEARDRLRNFRSVPGLSSIFRRTQSIGK